MLLAECFFYWGFNCLFCACLSGRQGRAVTFPMDFFEHCQQTNDVEVNIWVVMREGHGATRTPILEEKNIDGDDFEC